MTRIDTREYYSVTVTSLTSSLRVLAATLITVMSSLPRAQTRTYFLYFFVYTECTYMGFSGTIASYFGEGVKLWGFPESVLSYPTPITNKQPALSINVLISF